MFCTQIQKFSNFEPTLDYITLRNFGTVRPIFPKMAPKVAQDFKEKIHESLGARKKKKSTKLSRETSRGGGRFCPPPPPPGPFRVNTSITVLTNRVWKLLIALFKVPNTGAFTVIVFISDKAPWQIVWRGIAAAIWGGGGGGHSEYCWYPCVSKFFWKRVSFPT